MDVERSFKAQQTLGDVEENLDKLQRNQNQCLKDAEQMKEFDSLFGVVKAGSGLRKVETTFPWTGHLLDIKHGRIEGIPNQVSRSLRYLFQLSTWQNFKISSTSHSPHQCAAQVTSEAIGFLQN